MRHINFFLIIACCISLCFCSKPLISEDTTEINIDVKGNDLSVYEFIDSIKYIGLETVDSSLIGYVTGLYVNKERIYVMDYIVSKGIFVFKKNGEFLFKIQRTGNGLGEYLYLTDFFVDEIRKEIVLFTDGNKLIYFDVDGKYKKTIRFTNELGGFYFLSFEEDFFVGNVSSSEKNMFLYYSNLKNNKVINEFLKIPESLKKISITSDIGYSKSTNGYLFTYPNSTIIYELTENKIKEKYSLIVPKNYDVSKIDISEFSNMDERELTLKSLEYFSLESYFEVENSLFFVFSINQKRFWGLYNIMNKDLKIEKEEEIVQKSNNNLAYTFFMNRYEKSSLVGYIDNQALLKNDSTTIFNGININSNSNPIIFIAKIKQ